jgi:hypothetical protein
MKICKLALGVTLGFALAAPAQQGNSAPPQTSAPAATSDAAKIKALEDRVAALEGQISALTAAISSSSGPTPAPVQQQAAQPAPQASPATQGESVTQAETGQTGPSIGGAAGMAKALNPDISAIGDFIADAGHNPFSAYRSLEMHETELAFQSVVDPYARADFFISFGEEGVNLEEGYITFTSLPKSFVARVGKMRAAFGKVNTLHNHVLPWVDRPLVSYNLVGGEDGINDAGLSVQRILPAPKWLFLEGTGQVFRGDSADIFHAANKNDVSVVGHLRGYHDITDNTNLDLGVSYAHGSNDAAAIGTLASNLYGIDATLRWKPLQRSIYHSFVSRSEFIWNQRQQLPATRKGFGWYTSADYQLGRRWFVGGRYDWSDHQTNPFHDSGGSAILTYWPSEFAQIRGQYRHMNYGPFANVPLEIPSTDPNSSQTNELLLQVQFAIGAHGAHPF